MRQWGMRIFSILVVGAVTVAAADFKPTAQGSIVAKGTKAELVWSGGKFTEGPTLGPKGVIFFSDIGMRTMRFDPASEKTTVFREPSGKANGLMMDRKGNLIACEGAHGGEDQSYFDGEPPPLLSDVPQQGGVSP